MSDKKLKVGLVEYELSEVEGGWRLDKVNLRREVDKLELPDMVDDKPVVELGSSMFVDNAWFARRVVIGKHVKKIDSRAFKRCLALGEVQIPEGVEEIGDLAFFGCELRKLSIPASVTSIGDQVTYLCRLLREINVAEGNEKFFSKDGVLFEGQKLIAFPMNHRQNVYVVPDGVKEIGYHAFECAFGLRKVFLPDDVISIDEGAFNMSSINSIILPATIHFIALDAFKECTSLSHVYMPGELFGKMADNAQFATMMLNAIPEAAKFEVWGEEKTAKPLTK